MIKKTLLAATLLAATGAAQAELVEFDWEVAGDGEVTLDTNSGKLWLDLDVTQDMSINQVKDLLANDVRFDGWRLPTSQEIQLLAKGLFASMGTLEHRYSGWTVGIDERAEHALMGQPTAGYTYGLYEMDGGSYLFGSGGNGLYLNYAWDSSSLDFHRRYEGVYLVSDTSNVSVDSFVIDETMNATNVSAPIGFAAAGLLLGLAGMRRRKA